MSLTHTDLVRAIYLGVLGREADLAGMVGHAATLDRDGSVGATAALLAGFIASGEFRNLQGVRDALAALRVQPAGPPFRHAASLGTDCYPSWTLKQMGLKRYSLPFDWLFSSLPMITHCIADDFQLLLDPRQYRPVAPADRPSPEIGLCDHDHYRRVFGVRDVFNHFDPNELHVHAYLVRAANRLRRLLASPDPTLFLASVKSADPASSIPHFRHLADTLSGFGNGSALCAIVVLPPDAQGAFAARVIDRRGAHLLWQLQPASVMNGRMFDDPFDDLWVRRLVARHAFDLSATI